MPFRVILVTEATMTEKTFNTECPTCGTRVELPFEFETIICSNCGSSFKVSRYGGAIGLTSTPKSNSTGSNGASQIAALEAQIEELDENITSATDRIESLKSRENAGPLQLGCAIFSAFTLGLGVIIVFMALGRDYFGGALFYFALIVVATISLMSLRRRTPARVAIQELREERDKLTVLLAEMEAYRNALVNLRIHHSPQSPPHNPDAEDRAGASPEV